MTRRWSCGRIVATGLVLAAVATPCVARGQDAEPRKAVEQCFSSAEAAQPLMHRHELQAAARLLRECARDECPKAARTDCRAWLESVGKALPTVVFAAREEGGGAPSRSVDDVAVLVDGQRLAARLDGAPVQLDPGRHQLRFEHAGFDPVHERVELHEGERRQIDVVFHRAEADAPPKPLPPTATQPLSPPPASAPSAAPVPALAYGLLGTAVVALGAGVAFEIVGLSDRAGLVSSCQPTRSCDPSAVNGARDRVAAGDVLLGVGGVLVGAAAYVYFSRDAVPATAGGLRLRVGVAGATAALGLEGTL